MGFISTSKILLVLKELPNAGKLACSCFLVILA